MKTVTVYRVDNLLGLLTLARKTYGAGPQQDAIHIAVDNREARQAWMEHPAV